MFTDRTQIILKLLKALFDVFLLDLTLTDSLIQLIKVGRLVPLIIDADVELLSAQVKPQGARLDRCLWLLVDNRSRGNSMPSIFCDRYRFTSRWFLIFSSSSGGAAKRPLASRNWFGDLYCISGQREPNILTAFSPTPQCLHRLPQQTR